MNKNNLISAIGGLILISFAAYYIDNQKKINKLENQISLLSTPSDTILVRGKDSVSYKTKVIYKTISVNTSGKTKIDTTLTDSSYTIKLFTLNLTDSLQIKADIKTHQIEIIRTDTQKLPYPVIKEIKIPSNNFLRDYSFGIATGIISILLLFFLACQ
ncbi:MAG: hypothetical protein ACYC6P_07275 [Ignavibacteriaceae bacterium]